MNTQMIYKMFIKILRNIIEGKKCKILIIFDDMIKHTFSQRDKLIVLVTQLFIRERKWKKIIVFITQSYFKVPKEVRVNSTHFFYLEKSK